MMGRCDSSGSTRSITLVIVDCAPKRSNTKILRPLGALSRRKIPSFVTEPDRPDFRIRLLQKEGFTLRGNGMWQSCFQPTPIPFDNPCFQMLPVIELSLPQILPGMHYCADFAVKGWIFPRLREEVTPDYQHKTLSGYGDINNGRLNIVHKYFELQPWFKEMVDAIIDQTPLQSQKQQQCLGVHIRLTDKGSGREKFGVEVYLPYFEVYVQAQRHNTPMIFWSQTMPEP
ncbi:hypothetical protein IV203_034534 [Nitzschia inconspicua]|uniref:Uncharacterized protein n=1 Tax=Nitzschia inconspicua TaxID=303405 RepID=A0A9K3LEB5_9STRA|nr:hypothetical protein IV203_002589 [Nitzschia inconspicua]KAG7359436.1 hypothetical protein IV203_034534 [Nitzschia inconspicua]